MNRVKAFTILELVIVMIITSFIVIAGYFAYSSSVSRLAIFKENAVYGTEFSQFNVTLAKDIEESSSASLIGRTKLSLKQNESDEIIYQFDEDMVSRKTTSHTDTFNLSISQVIPTELEFDKYFLSGLSLIVESGGQELQMNYHKSYEPYFYMNHDIK